MAARKPARKTAKARQAAAKAAKGVRPRNATPRKAGATPRKVPFQPKGSHTLTPYLIVRDAPAALAFYARAFGAKEILRIAMPDGKVMHAEFRIGDSPVMLTEENPDWGAKSPQTLGGTATHLMVYVRDVDAAFARAIAAGCTAEMPPADMFWGDRYGKLRDPFGHPWSLGTHIEDVPNRQLQKRADAAMAEMSKPKD